MFDSSFSSDRYALIIFHADKNEVDVENLSFHYPIIVKFSVVGFVRIFHMLIL